MSKKKKIANLNLTLETIDKLNLIKVDVSFISNLLVAWNLNEKTPTYDDMHGMSRICDGINEQLNLCESLIEKMR
jgi:hypothetical protein